MDNDHAHHQQEKAESKIKAYWPLIVILVIVLLASLALDAAEVPFMHGFMGLFLAIFAMFKFLDLKGFADGFQTYDLIAQRWRSYAYAYPFLELGLGLAYLSSFLPTLTYTATLLLMIISAAGVLRSIVSGRKIHCACLGTVLKVPLSTVSAVENIGMGLMAAIMLL